MQDFENLEVGRRSVAHAVKVKDASFKFPDSGYASLKGQMTRAAESIVFNIAEGCGASTPREFARYLSISIKSSTELQQELRLAHDYGILPESTWRGLIKETVEIRMMLCGLRKRVLGDVPDSDPATEHDN
jgi:four helix bundle protein